MRFVIRQISPLGERWLIRATPRGVWGQQERARRFFTKATAERWAAQYRRFFASAAVGVIEDPGQRTHIEGSPRENFEGGS